MIKKNKKFGGTIFAWRKVKVDGISRKELNSAYGKNLGYVIRGYIGEDPTGRGFDYGPLRTSLVVKMNEDMTEIETLNTIYHLGAPDARYSTRSGKPLGREIKMGDLR